jgi:hypothetical protein
MTSVSILESAPESDRIIALCKIASHKRKELIANQIRSITDE